MIALAIADKLLAGLALAMMRLDHVIAGVALIVWLADVIAYGTPFNAPGPLDQDDDA